MGADRFRPIATRWLVVALRAGTQLVLTICCCATVMGLPGQALAHQTVSIGIPGIAVLNFGRRTAFIDAPRIVEAHDVTPSSYPESDRIIQVIISPAARVEGEGIE